VIDKKICSVTLRVLLIVLMMSVAAGCGGDMSDLNEYVAGVKERRGGHIDPLPQIKPYETFVYRVGDKRSPFLPDRQPVRQSAASGPTPDANRNKEYLEQFPLDTLNMVGTLEREGKMFGLVQTQDGLVHRVLPGNYVGQNDGRIVQISEARIDVEELVPNGLGSFFNRSAAIGLD
jgi:type IV pilus assembly protein PilP